MNLVLGSDFRRLAAKIYTFGFIALGIKFLTVDFITMNGVRVPLNERSIIVGAFGSLTATLTFAASLTLIKDAILRKVADTIASTDYPELTTADFQKPELRNTFAAKHYGLVVWLSRIAFGIEGFAPILFGLAITLAMSQDIHILWITFFPAGD